MVFAAQTAADRWLSEHTLVLGLLALALGAGLLAFGARNVFTGTTRNQYGMQVEGAEADMYGVIRMAAGVGLVLFGGYKLLTGLW